MKKKYDTIIVGGGLVGSVMAIALAQLGQSVAIIESNKPISLAQKDPRDDRAIVLSMGSKNILESLGVWSTFEAYTSPIKTIHVSDKGHFGKTRIKASDENVEALGFVVLAHPLAIGLSNALQQYVESITTFYSSEFEQFDDEKNLKVTVDGEKNIFSADLIIAADGSQSPVRKALNIKANVHDYEQSVVIAQVETELPHNDIAYERFTPNGPLALLPFAQHCAVIWTLPPEEANEIVSVDQDEFIAKLQAEFGQRLGRLSHPTSPHVFPLQLIYTNELGKDNVILIGNSAHTLHPIAGQGLNLGLRDVAQLAELIFEKNSDLLAEFTKRRSNDHDNIINLTNNLVGLFSNSFLPAVIGRNVGLHLMDRVPLLRSQLAKRTMGLACHVSKLSSRIPIKEWC